MLDEMLTGLGPANGAAERAQNAKLLGDFIAFDAPFKRKSYAKEAITGDAPKLVEGVKSFLASSEGGERRDVSDVNLTRSRVATREGKLFLVPEKGEAYPLRRHAFGQLCREASAPPAYLAALPPSMAIESLNWGLKTHAQGDRVLRLESNEIRAIVSAKYTAVDDRTLGRMFYSALKSAGRLDEAQVEAWSTGLHSTLRVSFGKVNKEGMRALGAPDHLVVGASSRDRGNEGFGLRACVAMTNAELGNGAYRFSAGFYRHWCNNGALIEAIRDAECVWARRHTGDWEAQAADLGRALNAIIETAERVLNVAVPGALADSFDAKELLKRLDKMPKLTRRERHAILLEALGEAFGQYQYNVERVEAGVDAARRKEAEEVFEALRDAQKRDEMEEVLSVIRVNGFDLVNGVTAVARDTENGERALELEALGGKILAQYLN